MRDDDEALWETPAAGVRRLRNRGGGDGSSAGAADGVGNDAGEWEQAPGARGGGAHVWVVRPGRDHAAGREHDHDHDHDHRAYVDAYDHDHRAYDDAYDDAYDHASDDKDEDDDDHVPAHPAARSTFDAALTSLTARPRPRRRVPVKLLVALALFLAALVAAVLVIPRPPAWPPPAWIFAACDVGQGDGLVLADGPHTGIVVDTGPDPGKEDRCLADLGVTHVKLLVLTHFHADHIDGVPGVLKHRTVDEIETTVLDDPPEGARKVAAWAEASGVRVSRAALGERRAYGPVAWDVLWPDPLLLDTATAGNNANAPPPTAKRSRSKRSRSSRRSGSKSEEGSAPNNASIVLRVRVATADGPVTLLLTGDIEPPAQEALLARYPELTADVLKIPHHGSAHQDPDLVARVRPRAAVISVGRGNTYGHPAPRTLTLAASGGARVLRTDDDGTVLVVGPASRLRVVLRK